MTASHSRWNIEPLADGRLHVCTGDHERWQGCEWEVFVPEAEIDALREDVERHIAIASEEAETVAALLALLRRIRDDHASLGWWEVRELIDAALREHDPPRPKADPRPDTSPLAQMRRT